LADKINFFSSKIKLFLSKREFIFILRATLETSAPLAAVSYKIEVI